MDTTAPEPPSVPPAPTNIATKNYPFATSPDILRVHQKDAYMTAQLSSEASNILRSLLGARVAHKYSTATSTLSELLYLCLTTLLGNRTLGEEYCDVIQISSASRSLPLPNLLQRLCYIISVTLTPWALSHSLPALRRRLRTKLESTTTRARSRLKPHAQSSTSLRIQEYILKHLDTLTSLSPIYALSLTAFYFTGSYYHLSKRLTSLRYIFTKQLAPHEQREGYEVLGVLLVLQIAVQSVLHVRETFFPPTTAASAPGVTAPTAALVGPGIELPVSVTGSDPTLQAVPTHLPPGLAANTATPVLGEPRIELSDPKTLAYIGGGVDSAAESEQQRKCTLCLEPYKDPSVTSCGHVFCWECVMDWVKEKAECPLCRQRVAPQKVLPLRGY
jgi:peroxin-10